MKKAYFIDYSGSVRPKMLTKMAEIGLAMHAMGHEVFLLDAAGPKKATGDDLRRPDLLRGGGTPSVLDQFILTVGSQDPGKHWEWDKSPHPWDEHDVTLLTDGDVPDTLSVCFDNVLVFSLPKEDLVRDVMSS